MYFTKISIPQLNTNRPFFILVSIFLVLGLGSCSQPQEEPATVSVDRLAVELIFSDEAAKDSLFETMNFQTGLESYHWKNHVVLFGKAADTTGLAAALQDLSLVDTKVYETPLYAFDHATHCDDGNLEEDWKDYLLTANLVEDPVLQQEYMDYHAKQFEEWPDVAQGFCHADFQQLLVYRNGRQLLLVISIPKDKTLDELNPKTTENNPQMDEWNKRMGKYQEGIAGTAEGEVWVFLEPLAALVETE